MILLDGLREQDHNELVAAGHSNPADVLRDSVALSTLCCTITVQGVPAGVFGVAQHSEPNVGVPWMLGSDRILGARRELLRQAPLYVALFLNYFPTLVNAVHVENTISVRWLARMGFTFGEELERPGGLFRVFFTHRSDSNV